MNRSHFQLAVPARRDISQVESYENLQLTNSMYYVRNIDRSILILIARLGRFCHISMLTWVAISVRGPRVFFSKTKLVISSSQPILFNHTLSVNGRPSFCSLRLSTKKTHRKWDNLGLKYKLILSLHLTQLRARALKERTTPSYRMLYSLKRQFQC